MVVTNVTDPLTGGNALEGTVNRILLKIQAGGTEICRDIKFRITCGSTVLAPDGTTRRLAEEESSLPEEGLTAAMKNPAMRTPVLVTADPTAKAPQATEFGYDLPIGWCLLGKGHGDRDERRPPVQELQCGESTYIWVDLFRPVTPLSAKEDDETIRMSRICQTDFDITITYRQAKPTLQKQPIRRGSRRRKPASEPSPEDAESLEKLVDVSDLVILEYSGSVSWTSPLLAKFSLAEGVPSFYPSGSRHPSNSCSDGKDVTDSEIALVDGQRFSAKCSLRATAANEGLSVEIIKVTYKDVRDSTARHSFTCYSDNEDNVIYKPRDPNDPSRILSSGSVFSLAYTLEPKLMKAAEEQYISLPVGAQQQQVSTRMGALVIDWCPVPLDIPAEASTILDSSGHGPLVLQKCDNVGSGVAATSCMEVAGPWCYIESAPFETTLERFPSAPRVAVPFDVSFSIRNKTGLLQKLSVVVSSDGRRRRRPSSTTSPTSSRAEVVDANDGNDDGGILLAGLVNGEITLSPLERQTISYTALATRAGEMYLPALSITSLRYHSYVIHEDHMTGRCVFVLP